MTELNQFIHARTLLKHVFTVFSKTRNGSIQSSNSTNGNTSPPTITLSIKSLSLDSSNKSISTSAGESEEDDEINSTTDSSINESLDEVTEDDKLVLFNFFFLAISLSLVANEFYVLIRFL